MARTNATNFTSTLQFPKATAATDLFKKEDVQVLAEAVDQHDHSAGKGVVVNVTGIAAGAINGSQITDNTITSAKITDGTIATVDLANASVTNAKLASDTARLNLLTNGGFEIWQRGNGPFTVNGVWFADRWILSLAGTDTMSIVPDTVNVDGGSSRAAAVTYVRNTGNSSFYQIIKTTDCNLSGRVVSFSVRVRTSVASTVTATIAGDVTGATSTLHTGGGTWQTLTATATVNANATQVLPFLQFAQSCTAYIDNAMLVVGSQAADYAPMHPADDLARCLRYYEVVGNGSSFLHAGWAGAASEAIGGPLRWQVPKAVTPTVTKVGTWGVGNCAQPAPAVPTVDGAQFFALSTAIGHVQFVSGSGIILTVESNP